jgi:hypothetical protein
MAYAVPHRFAHGDIPTAAQLTTYTDALDAIYAVLGDVQQFYGAASLKGAEDNNHWFIRRPGLRWLWVRGDGTLTVPAVDIGDDALTDSNEPTRFDLDALGVPIGALFYVSDSLYCVLTRDP